MLKKPHGAKENIKLETLKILKDNRRRFNKRTEGQTEYIASNYLNKMLAEEEHHLKQKFAEEKAARDRGKPKALFKYLEWQKRAPSTIKYRM